MKERVVPVVREGRTVGFEKPGLLRVAEVPRDVAVDVIRARHYSRKVYVSSFIHLGIFAPGDEPGTADAFAPDLRGIIQLGPLMNPASFASVVRGTLKEEHLELNRMWLCDSLPRNSESQALSLVWRYLRAAWPRVAWVQSFADERCGRYGVTYQAANFVYCGEHLTQFYELDGETFHKSIHDMGLAYRRRKKAGQNPAPPPLYVLRFLAMGGPEKARVSAFRQFRYIYFLRHGFRARLAHKEQPYPKHAEEVARETRAAASREGRGQFPHSAPIKRRAKA